MQTSKSRTGSSRTRTRDNKAEGFTSYASLCDTPSAPKRRPEEARRGEEGPLLFAEIPVLQQDANKTPDSVVDETHAVVPPSEGPTTVFAPPLAPSTTGGQIADPGHHTLMSRRLTVTDRTAISGSQEQWTLIGSSQSMSSSEGSDSNGSRFAVGGEAPYKLDQRDKNAPSLGRSDKNYLHTDCQSNRYNYNQVRLSEPAVVERQNRPESEQVPMVDLVDGSKHGRTSEPDTFDMKPNSVFDMDADFSGPMVEDHVELQFGTTTFHPHLVCQPSPYSAGINEQQDDIVLEDSIQECVEDSAMEDAEPETWEVAGMATATRMVQLPSTSLVVPSNEYVSPFGVLPWPHVETLAFVDTLAPVFELHMPHELHAPNSVALHRSVFPQAAPLQDNAPLLASDQVQASTSVAEIDSLQYQEPVGVLESPITALDASASQTASCSSHSPLFPSPPRAVSTPVSTPASTTICTHTRDYQREIEGVCRKFDSAQDINDDAGIQHASRYV